MVRVNGCGIAVTRLTAESQVIGAMIQGVSWALFENRILDRNIGTMGNANLEWYKVLAPKDMFEAVAMLPPTANAGNNPPPPGNGEPCLLPPLGALPTAGCNAPLPPRRARPSAPTRV